MADPQGICEYGGFNLLGGEYTASRGVQPGVFRLRSAAEPTFAKYIGTLRLKYGTNEITFRDCILGPHVQRVHKGRHAYQWSIKVYDKRWKWRYPRISGQYNIRDCGGQIIESTRKTFTELLSLLLNALNEPQTLFADIPDTYPEVRWDNAYAARELEWLLDWHGLVLAPQLDDDIRIERLGSGQGLPVSNDNISPVYTYNQTVMPSSVHVRTGPTIFQSLIWLEAVGLDTDGTIKRINDLSYKPAGGWETQWYNNFADVAPILRHLAFRTVWRWYRLQSQYSDVGNASVETMANLRLLDRLAESHADDSGNGRCLDPVVTGVYWPLSDHKANNDIDLVYSGPFKLNKERQIVEFEYPVIKWSANGFPTSADLKLYVAYNAVGPTGEYINEVFTQSVSGSIANTGPRVEKRPYLRRVRNFASPYGVYNGDNFNQVQLEADEYLKAVISTYASTLEADMLYGGLLPINLTGNVAQVRWRWGLERVATTRASVGHEFDVTQRSHQERRRVERLGQLFDRVMET